MSLKEMESLLVGATLLSLVGASLLSLVGARRLHLVGANTLRQVGASPLSIVGALVVATVACGQPEGGRALPAREGVATAAAPATAPAVARPRIVFLGDSLTAGYGLTRGEEVPALIQARLDKEGYRYEVVNAGVSGDTSAGGLSRLDWSLEGTVAALVVELGGNDGLRGLPVSQMKQNLAEIITRAKQRGIKVVLTGMEAPPNYGPLYTSEFRQVFRDLAKEHDVVFVPFYLEGVAGNSELNLSDGIHPNAAGSRIIEERLWRALEPLLEKQD
jgi:acyl-CoA thioesterase-1